MANELIAVLESGIATQATFSQFTNDKLNRLTMRIHELTQATKRNLFEIAVSLSAIDAEKLHETAGYKSIHEYAEKNFGYKKSMVYKLLDVARKYIEPTEIDGCIVYVSKLAHADTDYSVSQLMEINRVEFDVAKSLDSVGAIMPSMTTITAKLTQAVNRQNPLRMTAKTQQITAQPRMKQLMTAIFAGNLTR